MFPRNAKPPAVRAGRMLVPDTKPNLTIHR